MSKGFIKVLLIIAALVLVIISIGAEGIECSKEAPELRPINSANTDANAAINRCESYIDDLLGKGPHTKGQTVTLTVTEAELNAIINKEISEITTPIIVNGNEIKLSNFLVNINANTILLSCTLNVKGIDYTFVSELLLQYNGNGTLKLDILILYNIGQVLDLYLSSYKDALKGSLKTALDDTLNSDN
ncbi:MAG: hypothetical protein NTV30_04770, partial [Chloroflexi bacterium]|nr:hypothetical protein [Chloroflexota bacterium]